MKDNPIELAKSAPEFKTMDEMHEYYYGSLHAELQKTDYTTGTSGGFNAIFGPKLWYNVNTKSTIFGSMRKEPYKKSGYRAITDRAHTSTIGLSSQGAAVPASAVLSFAEVDVGLKEMAAVFDQAARLAVTSGKDDQPTWEELRTAHATDVDKRFNEALAGDATTASASWHEIEPLDRIVSSYAEVTNCGSSLDANDADIYGLDRDAQATWADAYVNHNSDTNQTLTLKVVDSLEENCRPRWSDSAKTDAVYYTGFDTLAAWSRLLQPNQRFTTERFVSSVNGIRGVGGQEAGFKTQTYNGIPIIPSNDIQQKGSGGTGLRQIFLIDPETCFISTGLPIQYMESDNYLHVGNFIKRGAFYFVGNTACVNFGAQGKVTNIKV